MPSETRLTTDRIRLRSMEDRDKEHLLRLFTDKEVMKYYPGVKNERETQEWIAWNKRNEKGYRVSLWIAEDKRTGEFLGQCGIVPQKIGNEIYIWKSDTCLPGGTGGTAMRQKQHEAVLTMASMHVNTEK